MEKTAESKKDLFQDLPVEARAGMLRAQAYGVETEVVQRVHDETTLAGFKDELATKSVTLAKLLQEKKDATAAMDAEIKPLKAEVGQVVKELRHKYSENEEEVFLLDDQDNGVMEIYDACGKFIRSRRLLPSEKQTSIMRNVSNG